MRNKTRLRHAIAVIAGACALWACQAVAQSVTYSYDALGRLTGASYDNGSSIAYSYDAAGNRTSVVTTTAATPQSATISTSGNNLNIWNYLVSNGLATTGTPGNWTVTISGTWGTTSSSLPAVDTGTFPSGSVLSVILTGTVNGNYTAANYPVGSSYQFSNKGSVTGTVTQ